MLLMLLKNNCIYSKDCDYYNSVTADQIQPALSKTTEASDRYSVASKRSNDTLVAYELRKF